MVISDEISSECYMCDVILWVQIRALWTPTPPPR